jgi:hypothetical protein
MAFIAECPFCHIKLQKVPDHREGSSSECPRCRNLFTLTVMLSPPKPRTSRPKIAIPAKMAPARAAPANPAAAPVMAAATPGEASVGSAPILSAALPASPQTLARRHVDDTDDSDPEPLVTASRLLQPESGRLFGVASLFLGGSAFCAATLFGQFLLTLALGGAGTCCAVLGLRLLSGTRDRSALPLLGLLASSAVVVLVLFWPTSLGFPSSDVQDLTERTGYTGSLPPELGPGLRLSPDKPLD